MSRASTRARPKTASVAGVRAKASTVKGKLSIGSRLSSSPSSLAAAEAVTTGAIVTYDILNKDGHVQGKLPRPGPIVATIGFYTMLGLAAAASETFAPVVVAVGWVLALTVLVTGKRGRGIVSLLRSFARITQRIGQGGATA